MGYRFSSLNPFSGCLYVSWVKFKSWQGGATPYRFKTDSLQMLIYFR
ncbi:hypothetical protein NEIPOLOT_01326 [Neisseria polysaccharea ATCC 43768]|nr:hypothetical protein NEIPOLOT_01326 [Neisseria polysaccharea ATCC 43768]